MPSDIRNFKVLNSEIRQTGEKRTERIVKFDLMAAQFRLKVEVEQPTCGELIRKERMNGWQANNVLINSNPANQKQTN